MLKHKKYIQKQLHKSSRFLHKIYSLRVKEPFNDYEKHLWWLLGWDLSLSIVVSHEFVDTKIMLNHVIFAEMMVNVICSVCYPSFIFFLYDVTSTPHYISSIFRLYGHGPYPVVIIHAFYSFIEDRCLMNWNITYSSTYNWGDSGDSFLQIKTLIKLSE